MSHKPTNSLPKVIWITGLSGAGKSTIAQGLAKTLRSGTNAVHILDGDELRTTICKDLGFSEADRKENIRRAGEATKKFINEGYTVIAALISPYVEDRQKVREMFDEGQFIEVYIDTPIEVCMQRDPKGLYAKVINGDIKNFTGIDSPYQEPTNPEIRITTQGNSPAQSVEIIFEYLQLNVL
jgi:adenylyl-sulfate kinase